MWDDLVAWFQSPAGQRVIDSAVIPALAIIVAGVVAALIARGAVRGLLARADREAVASSVAALVDVARGIADGDEDPVERHRIARLRVDADVRLRLSAAPGAALAADWASLRLEDIEREATSAARSAAKDVAELRERLVGWARHPRRSKRLFAADVARLGAERSARAAAKQQSAPTTPEPAAAPAPVAEAPTEAGHEEQSTPPAAAPAAERPRTRGDASRDDPEQPQEPVRAAGRAEAEPIAAAAASADRQATDRQAADAATGEPEETRISTEPVLIQRTRLDSISQPIDPKADHARHARPAQAAASAAATAAEAAEPPEPAAGPATGVVQPARPPVAPPPPMAPKQPAPAWLDTYDDEAEVTRDIDVSKTPRPMSAAAVRDRTQTGDDIVPRH